MKVDIQESKLPAMVPVPLYNAIQIGSAQNDAGDTFRIFLGLDESIVAQLKKLSLDPADLELDNNTSDRKRFGEGSYEEWYAKSRVPFVLVREGDDKLAALMWYGPKQLGQKSMKHLSKPMREEDVPGPSGDEWHTVSFRSYPPFRGKGVMKDFAKATMDVYLHYFPNVRLWTGTDRSNAASMALSTKLGFTLDESSSDADWVAMVKTNV